jgi:hypothetical protein
LMGLQDALHRFIVPKTVPLQSEPVAASDSADVSRLQASYAC